MRKRARDKHTGATVLKAVAYARVSTKEQDKEGFSIPAQQKLLQGYAQNQRIQIVKEFVDVETAKVAGRTSFTEMVKYLKGHPDVRALLVEKTDRLYRNLRDWVIVDDLEDVAIHLVKEGIVLSEESRSTEKFVHGIKVLMAKNYVDNLSEEARKGMQEKASQGIWPSMAPIGYQNVTRPDGRRIIEIDPKMGPIIAHLFGWYASGRLSLRELTEKAHQAGLANKTGERVATSQIHHILRSRIYSGQYEWRGQRYHGSHQPLVSPELWARVQGALDAKCATKVRGSKRSFAFSGLISCGHCGCAMVGELKKQKYVYYHCTGFKGKCDERYVREEVLEAKLSALVGRLSFGNAALRWMSEALRQSHADQKKEHDAAIARHQGEHKRLQDRLHAMYLDKLDGRIDTAFFDKTSGEWRDRQEQLVREIAFLQVADRSYLEEGILLLELAQGAQHIFDEQVPDEKRRLLKFVLSNCTWKEGELTGTFRQPFDLFEKITDPFDPNGPHGGSDSAARPEWWACLDFEPGTRPL